MAVAAVRAVASAYFTTTGQAKTVTIPSATQAGDLLVLQFSSGAGLPDSTPPGWTSLASGAGGTEYEAVWTKTATAGDAGTAVTVTASTSSKSVLRCVVVRDATGVAASGQLAETTADTTHDAPALTLPGGFGGIFLHLAGVKDTTTAPSTSMTPPAGTTLLERVSTGGVSAVSSGVAVTTYATSYTGGTWTVDAATANARTTVLAISSSAPPSATVVGQAMSPPATSSTTTSTFTLPPGSAAGDEIAIFSTANLGIATADLSLPGATVVRDGDRGGAMIAAYVWTKTLTGDDIAAGAVTVTWTSSGKICSGCVVVRGGTLQAVGAPTVGTTTAALPSVTGDITAALGMARVAATPHTVLTLPSPHTVDASTYAETATGACTSLAVGVATGSVDGSVTATPTTDKMLAYSLAWAAAAAPTAAQVVRINNGAGWIVAADVKQKAPGTSSPWV